MSYDAHQQRSLERERSPENQMVVFYAIVVVLAVLVDGVASIFRVTF
jgi:hypothetical protein